jgi:hypothetical protein
MAWETKLSKPVKLRNGRTIETIGEARDSIRSLPQVRRRNPEWQLASELLARASEATSLADDALAQLLRALKAEGLV